jgi:hypothetical protein
MFGSAQVTVWGEGVYLGMAIAWRLQWRPDGERRLRACFYYLFFILYFNITLVVSLFISLFCSF